MPEKDSVIQLNLWRQQEAITAHKLNQMVSAINFLLKTVGYLHNRTALANYSSSEASHTNYPGIIEKVSVNSETDTPYISYGHLILPPLGGTTPPANYDPSTNTSTPGTIYKIETQNYAPSDASVSEEQKKARIEQGKIIIPLAELTIETVSGQLATSASPGSDGWVETLYIWGLYTGDLDHMYATRQLMRVSGSTLQIVQQISYDGSTWLDFSANG